MKKAAIGLQQPIIAHGQTPEVSQPANRALHDPAASVPAQFPAILVRGLCTGDPRRNDGLNPSSDQPGPDGIAVIPSIGNQSVWPFPWAPWSVRTCHRDGLKGRFEEPDLRRGRRLLTARLSPCELSSMLRRGLVRVSTAPRMTCRRRDWAVLTGQSSSGVLRTRARSRQATISGRER